MGSITSWTRLEPQSNDPGLGSLAARVADPLWLLARQWQFREWQGEDAGSPVEVRVRFTASPMTRYQPGRLAPGITGRAMPDGPWEVLVEAEAPDPPVDRRAAATAGQRFLDLLGPELELKYRPALLDAYALADLTAAETAAADDLSQRWAALLAGRAVDGPAFRSALRKTAGKLPADLAVEPSDEGEVLDAVKAWLAWYDARFADPGTSGWQPDRLRYAFSIGAHASPDEVVLEAPDHRGGRVDWTSFEVRPGATLGAAADPAATVEEFVALPTGLAFPGMPAPRWWQFEDGNVDLGGIEAAPDDLGRLLLAEFALVYGNDYFCLPLQLPIGTICRISGFEVLNSFGETVVVPSAVAADGNARPRWRMFELGTGVVDDDAGAGWLVVPGNAVHVHTGDALEDVLFSRDEMSNIAWSVEGEVTGPAGSVVRRQEVHQRSQQMPDPPSGTPVARYELETPLPPHWLPLVPASAGPARVLLELRGTHQPLGRLLAATGGSSYALNADELPRSGVRVTRHNRRARWIDGRTMLWTAPKARTGRGEGSAGLRFDDLVNE